MRGVRRVDCTFVTGLRQRANTCNSGIGLAIQKKNFHSPSLSTRSAKKPPRPCLGNQRAGAFGGSDVIAVAKPLVISEKCHLLQEPELTEYALLQPPADHARKFP